MAQKVKPKKGPVVKKGPNNYQPGDLVVYPAHGVGRIETIESRNIGDTRQDFYIMKILETNMVIMIPTQNLTAVGIRNVICKKEVSKIYNIIRSQEECGAGDNQTWNRRYKEYMDKIKTGSLYEVAEVFRDLFLLKMTKDLSFGERKLLDTAQGLLVKELSIAKGAEEKTVISEIESFFPKMPPSHAAG
ncbi:CarD family transcriptional regulator [Desulfosudis oleivorans]|uniref:Transcriptional regulator, CarD family n=1 Tax=Desulfosudis oleivorans (strain DSM 6200 / JCM 39069 / Hxd3) TaxID=96561 RepID=A8ZXZ7_DESOH|nr:CarD family transcriptional regulator [Desulfosudis oleivorans]ABW68624.1 transcriptional regulator, CarD family [Desulfosudis oleivorans Hxd3]